MKKFNRVQWSIVGLYLLMLAWSGYSSFLTWKLLAGDEQSMLSPRGFLAILIESSKFVLWTYILRVQFRAGWLYVAVLGVALMGVSAFASLEYFAKDRAGRDQQQALEFQTSFEYQTRQHAVVQDNARIKSLQEAADLYAKRPTPDLTRIRNTQREIDRVMVLRDRHMQDLYALKTISSESKSLTAIGLAHDSEAVNVLIVIMMELVPLGIVVVIRDRKRDSVAMAATAITTQTTTTPSQKTTIQNSVNRIKTHDGSVFSQQSGKSESRLSIVKSVPDDEDEIYSDHDLPSDEAIDRAIKILRAGCQPSYEKVRSRMRIGQDEVRRVFYVLRKRGVLVRDGKRHALARQPTINAAG